MSAQRKRYRDDMHGNGRAFEPGQYRNNFWRRRNPDRWRPNYGQWKWRIAVNALRNF